ncbi:MAG: hypothetical protein ACYSU4_15375, partial [Planctomycetota bacterium]
KGSEALFTQHRERFWPTTQASGFAAGRSRACYLDTLYNCRELSTNQTFYAKQTQSQVGQI